MKSKKLTKTILKSLGIFILAILLLAIILPFVFKKQIIQAVKTGINENVNAKVDFADYHLSLFSSFPNFTLGLDKFTIIGVNEFDKDTLANIGSLSATIDLFSVFGGNTYKIRKISVDNARIILKITKDGKTNWDISKPSPPTPVTAQAPSTFKLKLQKVSISSSYILYQDLQGNMSFEMKNLEHVLKGDMTADMVTLYTKTTSGAVSFTYGGIPYLKNTHISMVSDIEADMKNSKYTFKNTEANLNSLVIGVDGFVAMPGKDIDMDLKYYAKKTEFKNLLSLMPAIYAKDFDKVETAGKLALDGFVKGVYNDKTMPAFGLNLLVENAMFKYPSLPQAVKNINIDVKIQNKDGKPDNTVIDMRKMHMEMAGNPLDMKMYVSTPVSDPNIDGSVKCKLNLAQVGQFYPMEAADQLNGIVSADITMKGRMSSIQKKEYDKFQAAGNIEINGMTYKSKDFPPGMTINTLKLIFSPSFVQLAACNLLLGHSDLQAGGRIDNLLSYMFKNEKLSGNFEMTSSRMDLNEFMSNDQAAAKKGPDTTSLSVIDVPANIDFTMKASFAKILYEKMEMTQVAGVIRIKDKIVDMEGLKMNMLGGTMIVTGSYNTQKKDPQTEFSLDISNFDIPQSVKTFSTIQKLVPIAEKSTGKFSTKMKFSTTLDKKMMPVYPTMNGSGMINASNIVIQGVEPLNKLADLLKMDKFKKIAVDKVQFEFAITNGKVEIKPNTFTFDKIKTTIGGFNGLDQSIDYKAVLEIPREMFGGQANAVLDNMVSKAKAGGVNIQPGSTVAVAAKFGGTFTKPVVTVDMKSSVSNAVSEVKQQVQAKAAEELNKVKAEADAKAQKLLADAAAKGQQLRAEAKKAGDAMVAEADKQGKSLVEKAGNPIAKMAAGEGAKKLVKEAQNKSANLQQDADKKANQLMEDAKQQAAKLK